MSPRAEDAGRERLTFLALSNYKVDWTKTVRDCCRCTWLMFPASFCLNVGSGCRSHAGYCFHILCSLSNGLLKTGRLLFWPPRLQSGMPWHCFPFLVDRRRGRRCSREEEEEEEEGSETCRHHRCLLSAGGESLWVCVNPAWAERGSAPAPVSTATHEAEEGGRPKSIYQPNIYTTGSDTQTHTHKHTLNQPATTLQ